MKKLYRIFILEPFMILFYTFNHCFWFVLGLAGFSHLINIVNKVLLYLMPAFVSAGTTFLLSIIVSGLSVVTVGMMLANRKYE